MGKILLENIIYKALTKLKKEEQMIILQHYFQFQVEDF